MAVLARQTALVPALRDTCEPVYTTLGRVEVPHSSPFNLIDFGWRRISLFSRSVGSAALRGAHSLRKGGRMRTRTLVLTLVSLFNPEEDPIVREALKEPIAFFGGIVAGLLRLDLKEEPLQEWVAKTAEAAGIELKQPGVDEDGGAATPEDRPVDISIE
eukprot:TRINITY_DN575_c0_g1_i1.p1 TRINITY_DN575_c0_g1~~TRINITY_DN575_c0_g1_i1.p1  ORF type:complete len:172 (-),score=33.74 TRINITY_DN575_c0_g1_i1:94-570(-)